MPGPTREWVTFDDPDDPGRPLLVDVTFLTSRWQCIFGCGCQGVLTEKSPELEQGCCSYGAHFSDKKDRARTIKMAERLTETDWQFAKTGRRAGVVAKIGKGDWRTRLHKGACIFLNRPGFEGGAGCAFHVYAMRTGSHHSDVKPDVCWQLPLRRVWVEDDDGGDYSKLTEFGREGWGEGGEEFAWWCTEEPEAFTGTEPVYRSLEPELRRMIGDALFEQIATYLDGRTAASVPPARHPSEVPLLLSRTRSGAAAASA